MRIAFLSKTEINIALLKQGLSAHEVTPCRSRDELLRELPRAEVLVVQNQGFPHGTVDAECLRAARRLRLIQHHGVGCDATDVEEAHRLGIPVATLPGQNSRSVAEHAFFLLLALARRIREAQKLVQSGYMGELQCTELAGKTLCVVGVGTIGRMLIGMGRGFSMRVIGVRRNPTPDDVRATGADAIYPSDRLTEALSEADCVILALPLTRETLDLMAEEQFGAMKPGALLVNVSRGPHVKRAALEMAVAQERLGGFAADVFWTEPPDPHDPLLLDDRVIYTPHMGGKSNEAMQRTVHAIRENIERLARGETVLHLVSTPASPKVL
jgi:phosphoglycerate dehydrogenase-like enzyme